MKRRGLTVSVVLACIDRGQERAVGTEFDPYAKYQTRNGRYKAMLRDATHICNWFNANRMRWDDATYLRMSQDVYDIQRGPAFYFRKLLQRNLTEIQFKASQSWAEREWQAPGSVDFDTPGVPRDLRDALASLLWEKGGLKKSQEPYNLLRTILKFAFFGPTTPGEKWNDDRSNRDFFDL